MPEFYDHEEVGRLLEDTSAIVRELDGRGAKEPTKPAITTAEEMPEGLSPAALMVVWEVLDKAARENPRAMALDAIAQLWLHVAEAIDDRDMAKLRNSCAGIRSIVMQELERGKR